VGGALDDFFLDGWVKAYEVGAVAGHPDQQIAVLLGAALRLAQDFGPDNADLHINPHRAETECAA